MRVMYWPDYTIDIIRTREQCKTCSINAPSNPRLLPSQNSQVPDYPFQIICMDYFQEKGKLYLAVVDRYSGWLSIIQFQKDMTENLRKALREYFSLFGVCETVCTDGAKTFTASGMETFF